MDVNGEEGWVVCMGLLETDEEKCGEETGSNYSSIGEKMKGDKRFSGDVFFIERETDDACKSDHKPDKFLS